MRTLGVILLAIVKFIVAVFVGIFVFLAKLALGWR